MDSVETNQFNMITNVIEYSDNNTAPVSGLALYGTTLVIVKSNHTAISLLNGVVTGTTTGVTKDTNQLRKTMVDFGLQCASAVFAYANSLTPVNQTLAASVNYNQSKFDKLTKEAVDDVCEVIRGITNTNIAVLAPAGITAPIVAAFGVSINDYSASIQKPRQAIVSKKTAKSQMTALIRSTIDIQFTNIMDRLVTSIKTTQSKFYDGYFSSRAIIDLGTTFTKFRGNAKDKEGNPLQDVIATLTKTDDDTITYTSKTNNKGNFKNVKVKPGNYNITYQCNGFKSQSELDFHFAPGSEIIHKIVMQPV